jgi:hypothetical protein
VSRASAPAEHPITIHLIARSAAGDRPARLPRARATTLFVHGSLVRLPRRQQRSLYVEDTSKAHDDGEAECPQTASSMTEALLAIASSQA